MRTDRSGRRRSAGCALGLRALGTAILLSLGWLGGPACATAPPPVERSSVDSQQSERPREQPGPKAASESGEAAPQARRLVVACVPPQRWLMRKLIDDRVEVIVLVEPGMSHETFSPTDAQASAVLRARLYLGLGLPHERAPWFRRVRGRVEVVDCRAGVAPRALEGHSHGNDHDHDCSVDGADPHVWTAPRALAIQARTIAAALTAAWPDLEDHLAESLPKLERELDALHEELAGILAPCRDRPMFVFHPAWGYFTDAFGMTQVPIEREGKQPSDRELVELQRLARREAVDTIFVQPQIDSRAAHVVARGIGGRVVVIDPLVEEVDSNLRSVARTIAERCR